MSLGLAEFEALSFDCYGTLIDWETGLGTVLGAWARARGLELDREALLTAYGSHEAKIERGHPTEPYPEILARSMRALGEQLGAEVTDADAAALAESVSDWPAFPDSHNALTSLGERTPAVSAWRRTGSSTWPRACFTTMFPPSERVFRPCGSTAATPTPAGARPRRPRLRCLRTGSSPAWPRSRRPREPSSRDAAEPSPLGCVFAPGGPAVSRIAGGCSVNNGQRIGVRSGATGKCARTARRALAHRIGW